MSLLSILLMTKIIITLLAVVLPFSLFNKEKLKHLSGLTGPSLLLFRLYAVAISALLVNTVLVLCMPTLSTFRWQR